MAHVYRIRDTQRFIVLPLLFPLMPLLLQIIRPAFAPLLYAVEAVFVVFTCWALFRTREMEIGYENIRIDSSNWAQIFSHEQILEIVLMKNNSIQIRMSGRHRYVRVMRGDYEAAVHALQMFTWRHAIPFSDKRPSKAMAS